MLVASISASSTVDVSEILNNLVFEPPVIDNMFCLFMVATMDP